MLSKETIINILDTNLEFIRRYGVKRIGLFGSYLREERLQDIIECAGKIMQYAVNKVPVLKQEIKKFLK
ncbi:hypothetical protein Tfer_3274 [Thermincola ferriacetica]|uniref:Uncharacterized protein n=1 Tax=Thermincola ferriacetica TaxID=281456 RepID=A0A0L6VXY3_9FIRM|nr:hypothetical protein [Thermincola ferriacetica]KNZ68192.1 hypothetical protein Tfer_3274 [Thermincola ferriacetica]